MIIWVLTAASSLSSLRVLASEASEDNAAVVTFKSRNLFRSSQAFAKKKSYLHGEDNFNGDYQLYLKSFYSPNSFEVEFRNLKLIRNYLKRFEFCI